MVDKNSSANENSQPPAVLTAKTNNNINKKAKLAFIKTKIEDKSISSLLDIGSMVCAVHSEFVRKYISAHKIQECEVPMTSVSQTFSVDECVDLQMLIDDEEEVIKHQFFVIENLPYPVLFGKDLIDRLGIDYLSKEKKWVYKGRKRDFCENPTVAEIQSMSLECVRKIQANSTIAYPEIRRAVDKLLFKYEQIFDEKPSIMK